MFAAQRAAPTSCGALHRKRRDLIIARPTGREFPKGEGAHALSLWTLLCTPPLLAKVTPSGGKTNEAPPVAGLQ